MTRSAQQRVFCFSIAAALVLMALLVVGRLAGLHQRVDRRRVMMRRGPSCSG